MRAEDGIPLADVEVRLEVRPPRIEASSHPMVPGRRVLSAADGHFELSTEFFGLACEAWFRAADRVPRTARWNHVAGGTTLELGDIELALGHGVRGFAIDEAGQPAKRVALSLRCPLLPLANLMEAPQELTAWSDDRGAFDIPAAVPAGTWPLEICSAGWTLLTPQRVAVTAGTMPLIVTLRERPKIAGIVCDEAGVPISGVRVMGSPGDGGWSYSQDTLQDGSFEFQSIEDDPQGLMLALEDAGRWEPLDDAGSMLHRWGTRDLRLALRRTRSFELTVVERESGQPVELYDLHCREADPRSSSPPQARFFGWNSQGRVVVDRLRRGQHRLSVVASDPEFLPSDELLLDVGEAEIPPQRIELVRMQRHPVRVRTASGALVEDAFLEVIACGDEALELETAVIERATSRSADATSPRRDHRLVSTSTTRSEGLASVLAPQQTERLALRLSHERYPRLLLREVELDPDRELELVLPLGATLSAHVHCVGHHASAISMRFARTHLAAGAPRSSFEVRLDRNARFRLEDVEPGRYQPQVLLHTGTSSTGASTRWTFELPLALEPLELSAGQHRAIEIDLSDHAPVELRGRVRLEAAAPQAARIELHRVGGPSFGPFEIDEEGAFVARGILPGTYEGALLVRPPEFLGVLALPSEQNLRVGPEASIGAELRFLRRQLVVHLREPDGVRPLAKTTVFWSPASAGFWVTGETDEQGTLVIDPAPRGAIEIELESNTWAPGLHVLGAIEMPRDQRRQELVLRRR
ncbi:MAG: hypothetical protein JNM84_21170 [Planctomycetes bacterium]|nr:hypothetical protein [Planctomycetota bacterium]